VCAEKGKDREEGREKDRGERREEVCISVYRRNSL
jgi:hypothetical protein